MTENKSVRLMVDDREITARPGDMLLAACLNNDIYIPHLCYLKGDDDPPASCRLCFVEVEGIQRPVTACTVRVAENMRVKTDTAAVRRLQRSAFELLLSVHHVACRSCPANRRCDLQKIARFLKVGLKVKRLDLYLKDAEKDAAHPVLDYFPNRCVLCGKCIRVCVRQNGNAILTFAGRGFDTLIRYYGGQDPDRLPCRDCLACVDVCPVGALVPKEPLRDTSPGEAASQR